MAEASLEGGSGKASITSPAAMSKPYEIEYAITFDSGSIEKQ